MPSDQRRTRGSENLESLLLSLGVFALCLAGILSRPHLGVATLWPANAFALGMLVRWPRLARSASWAAIAVGFFAADVLTGTRLLFNVLLNAGNLASIGTAWALFSRLPPEDRQLRRPLSVLYFLRAILVGSAAAGLFGMVLDPLMLGGSPGGGFVFWGVTEAMNYAALLPILLTFPVRFQGVGLMARASFDTRPSARDLMPVMALVLLSVVSIVVGGRVLSLSRFRRCSGARSATACSRHPASPLPMVRRCCCRSDWACSRLARPTTRLRC